MIKISQPALALHSFDVPGYKYKMWHTQLLSKYANAADIVNWIMWAIVCSPDNYLKNVIINCHGNPGILYTGEKEQYVNIGKSYITINSSNVGAFATLKDMAAIGTIWLVACKIAEGAAGKNFCAQLAKTAGCNVIGADKTQHVNAGFYLRVCPDNCIDKFEGTAFQWDAGGNQKIYKG